MSFHVVTKTTVDVFPTRRLALEHAWDLARDARVTGLRVMGSAAKGYTLPGDYIRIVKRPELDEESLEVLRRTMRQR